MARSDNELVDDFRRGKVEGFNDLVRRYQQKVYWIAWRILGDHDDADDLVQDVFVRVYESLPKFRRDAALYTWIYRITTNLALNALRKKRRREILRLDTVPEIVAQGDDPGEQLERKETEAALDQAIRRLPPKQKAVFVMRYYEQMSYEDIAKIMKRSVGGLKANYFHALRKIRKYVPHER